MTKLDEDARYFTAEMMHFLHAAERLLDKGASLPEFYAGMVPMVHRVADKIERAAQVKADAA